MEHKEKLLVGGIFLLIFSKIGQVFRLASGGKFGAHMILRFSDAFGSALTDRSFDMKLFDFAFGLVCVLCIHAYIYLAQMDMRKKKYRDGEEHGSADWGGEKDIVPFVDPVFENNMILTQTESMTMNNRPKDPKTARNKNVLVIGGSGSGKTRFFVKPNLMQLHSSYVVTDPKGSLIVECGKLLADNGYKIRVFNTVNFKKSMHYNPFHYIHSEKDIMKLVTTLIANTNDSTKTGGDPFWEKSETLLYMALVGYIHYELPPEEQNFASLLRMLNEMNASEDAMGDVPDENGEVHWNSNPVDILFEELRRTKPGCFPVLQYTKFKMAAGKTAKSILISCGVRLAPFDIAEVREITMYDELELDTLGGTKADPHTKTALFLIMSDTDKTFNFLLSMIYTQLFNLLCEKADDEFNGRLPIHVRCLIDEFANIGKIPDFEKLIATIRSREISACVILQAQSQLKSMYSDAADTIIGNMDSVLFLGGKESSTLKELSEVLGKQTIDTKSGGESHGREKSRSTNYQRIGRELMTQDELARMDRGKCILQISGVRPFFSDKYDITKHPRYHLLSDDNPANAFDITRYMDCSYRPLVTDACAVYEYEKQKP